MKSDEVKIQAGDEVFHKPTQEDWFVLGVNYARDQLCVAGWPATIAKLSDCTLLKRGKGLTEEELAYRTKVFGGPGWE